MLIKEVDFIMVQSVASLYTAEGNYLWYPEHLKKCFGCHSLCDTCGLVLRSKECLIEMYVSPFCGHHHYLDISLLKGYEMVLASNKMWLSKGSSPQSAIGTRKPEWNEDVFYNLNLKTISASYFEKLLTANAFCCCPMGGLFIRAQNGKELKFHQAVNW